MTLLYLAPVATNNVILASVRCNAKHDPSRDWIKVKNPAAPAVRRKAEEDWGKRRG
jgi:hypothetical protein